MFVYMYDVLMSVLDVLGLNIVLCILSGVNSVWCGNVR